MTKEDRRTMLYILYMWISYYIYLSSLLLQHIHHFALRFTYLIHSFTHSPGNYSRNSNTNLKKKPNAFTYIYLDNFTLCTRLLTFLMSGYKV